MRWRNRDRDVACGRGIGRPQRWPPIRAIRIGRALRPRCRRFRSRQYGPARRSTMSRTNGRTMPKSARWCRGWRQGARRSRKPRRRSRNFSPAPRPTRSTNGKLLFAGLFDTLNAQRSSVMNGLERVTRKQREAADKIRADTLALQALQDASPPDQAKIDELGNQLVWETRIFEDRRRRDQIRLRGADRDRPAAVRARPRDPAGNGIASSRRLPASAAVGSSSPARGSGCDSANGNSARCQPSVPSGYQATLG